MNCWLSSKNSGKSNRIPIPTLSLSEMKELVSKRLEVIDAYIDTQGVPTFTISNIHLSTVPKRIEERFKKLVFDCYKSNLMPLLRKEKDQLVLRIYSKPPVKRARTNINIILFFVTICTIFFAGYYLWGINELWSKILLPNANPFVQAALFSACLFSIIGIHEMGHKLTCDNNRLESTMPYFIPGPPPFGTFGALISLKSPPINKNQLFDLGISGPISGFIATVIVCFVAVYTSIMVPESQVTELGDMVGPIAWPSSPLLFLLIFDVISAGFLQVPQGMTMILGQVTFAAQVGCLLTFLNTMPVWQLDGGHVAKSVLGPKGYRTASYIGLAVLMLSGYYFFAFIIIIFMMSRRRSSSGAEILEDVSPLSLNRKRAYFVFLLISALCFFMWIPIY